MVGNSEIAHLPNEVLDAIASGTFDETGTAFFDQLVKQVSIALGTKYAWVTEWLEEQRKLRALSFWSADDGQYRDYEYRIGDTPCEHVIREKTLVHIPDRVLDLFPGDPDLSAMEAVSYMGVPLQDLDGSVLGHLAVLHNAVLPERPEITTVLKIFAGRAGAELRRIQRDRSLQEREKRLRSLVDSAMDGIVELNSDQRIVRMNPAALRVLCCDGSSVAGTPIGHYLTETSVVKLRLLLDSLCAGKTGHDSLWIVDGLDAVTETGKPFRAEVTISCYEVVGERFYTLFVRSIDDRIQAEQRIQALLEETATLRAEIDSLQGFSEVIGCSKALRNVLRDVQSVANSDAAVLITGETGTGKELIASAIHRRSGRNTGPFVKVNCAAIPATLQESEFFGHERGAFTGATQRRDGRFKQAHRGTIFLDEVGELPLDLQAKLLRVLQEGEYQTVGGSATIKADVRVIAATNRNLEHMVHAGTFRADLFYRLNVFPITVPALRERGGDILLLARSIAENVSTRRGLRNLKIRPEDEVRLQAYDWPGNVRELQNVIERAILTSVDGRTLNLARALPDCRVPAAKIENEPTDDKPHIYTADQIRELERENIVRALSAAHWKVAGRDGAAELLGMNPNTLASRIKRLHIERGVETGRAPA